MKRENFGCNYLERGFQNEEKQGSPISSDFRSCNCFNANLLYVYIIAGNFTIHSICENEKERIT